MMARAGRATILREVDELVYDCDRIRLGAPLAARFQPLARDEEVDRWLARWRARPHGLWATKLVGLLERFVTTYEAHGLLGAYPMHMLSERAWGELLGGRVRALLDVGAGAGYLTERARAWCDEIVCTETSRALRRRLAARGFAPSDRDLTDAPLPRTFEAVSCLNVLDRTARPLTLLRSLVDHLAPDGRLLISFPLPPAPHVHVAGGTTAPSERLPSLAADWETAARELSERLFEPAGLTILRLARVPYLSRGDIHAPIYALDAALWVLTRR